MPGSECGGAGLYQDFVMPTVSAMDQSRPVWPSCPAPGWKGGVHTLDSTPDGTTLITGVGGTRRPGPFPFAQEAHGESKPLGAARPHALLGSRH